MRNTLVVAQFLISFAFILTCLHSSSATNTYTKADIYEKVGLYLRNNELRTQQQDRNPNDYLPNSNKIGQGFNPVYGSPFCYTSACPMEGFRFPIFKLQYQSPSQGACTHQLVPNFVMLDCRTGIVTSAITEVISTVQQLSQSISNKIEVSVGTSYAPFSFSYMNSKETSFTVDNIVQNNLVLFYTSAQVSQVKLSMFEPLMTLSDEFRYVIEQLPCCDNADDDLITEKYIQDYVLNYFGYTYVSTLTLGGLAQQNIFMKRDSYERLESKGVSTKNAAKVAFYVSVGVTDQNSQSSAEQKEFMKEIHSSYDTKLGGDPSVSDLHQWTKTIPANPVIIRFGVKEIFDLLTPRRFPNDLQIQNKSKLIEKILKKYIQHPLYCYNNCSGILRGRCEASGYFQFGICQCNSGWTGIDCSTRISTTTPPLTYPSSTSTSTTKPPLTYPSSTSTSTTKPPLTYPSSTSTSTTKPPLTYPSSTSTSTTKPPLTYPSSTPTSTTKRPLTYPSSTRIPTTKPPIIDRRALSGTLCGYDRSHVLEKCDGKRPWDECPVGWIRRTWSGADFTVCYKASSLSNSDVVGVLCGLHNYGGKQLAHIPCNNIYYGVCPAFAASGYISHSSSVNKDNQQYFTKFCFKSNPYYSNLPGTLCGIQWEGTTDGPQCDGYDPGLRQCPPGYILQYWTLETGKRFFLCSKG